jgi:BirA family transcriptional regulator, biotin operon repressor / biotin---[acetyl-CoA-carboxylase] ligase
MLNPDSPLLPLDPGALSSRIADLRRFGSVRYLESVDSTNAAALASLDDKSLRGCTIVAEAQSAGRGRAGRSWNSPSGSGIMMTTIMPNDLPNQVLPALGYWTGLCVAEAIAQTCGVWPTLKWPNDLMIGASKLSGILIEGRTLGAFTRAVVGVGINVNRPAHIPQELEGLAAWLSDAAARTLDRTDVIATVLHTYELRYDHLLSKPIDVIREWSHRSAVSGRRLRVSSAQGQLLHEGIGRGLTDDGALLLETQDGPVTVRLGDVSAM